MESKQDSLTKGFDMYYFVDEKIYNKYMHLNIKSPLFFCLTQKKGKETINDDNDVVIKK